MAAIRKRGDKWIAEVRVKGTYRSKTHDTKASAQRWALDLEQSLGRANAISGSFGEAMARFAKEISPARKGGRWEIPRLAKFQRDPIAAIMLDSITGDDFQQWINRQTTSPATINRDLNLMGSVLRDARKLWRWTTNNPMREVSRPKQPPARDRLISQDEIKRVLLALEYDEQMPVHSMRQQIAVAFLLALETAMRQGEIWGLRWEAVQLERRFLTLTETKNGTRRDVPLSLRAVELFKKIGTTEGRVITCNQASAQTVFRRAVALAGIENLTFHDSRHEAITRLARKLDVLDLARMVGHKDLRSLQIYYNATAEDIAKRL